MQHDHTGEDKGSWKDWLWMVVCCVPMIAIFVLVWLGVWSFR